MALATHVTNRYPAQELKNLTNPNDRTATTIDTAYLAYAVSAAESDFQAEAQLTYDDTDERHIAIGVQGVIAYLMEWNPTGGAAGDSQRRMEAFHERLRQLALGGPRARITPTSTSILETSPEQSGSETVRPDFDRERFADFIPTAPDSGADEDYE